MGGRCVEELRGIEVHAIEGCWENAGGPKVVKNEDNRVSGRLTVRPTGTVGAESKSGEQVRMEGGEMLARRPTVGLV